MTRHENDYPLLDGEQLLEDLASLGQIGRNAQGGIDRTAFSSSDLEGRRWVDSRMQTLGLSIRQDAAGNSIGLYSGSEDLPPLAIGSHTDTVPNGGAYDGSLGVLSALACVRALHDAGICLRHALEVINFSAEEATMSGGTLGSRAMAGLFDADVLSQAAWDGRPVHEHLLYAGLDPARIHTAKRKATSMAAFLELHIEQGDTLLSSGQQIGVVEGIVGIRRYIATFHGYANHAGTTPMDGRQDALVAAAPYVAAVRDIALAHKIVGTVGKADVAPGAPNVIPGRVDLHVEIRGLDETILDAAEGHLSQTAQGAGAVFSFVSRKPAVQADALLVDTLAGAGQELSLDCLRMPSGAGHDAMNMASLCPTAMLFVPSQGGVSHSPDEYTTAEDCVNGARVLLAALLQLDQLL